MPNHSLETIQDRVGPYPGAYLRAQYRLDGKPELYGECYVTLSGGRPGDVLTLTPVDCPGITSIPALEKALMLQDRHA